MTEAFGSREDGTFVWIGGLVILSPRSRFHDSLCHFETCDTPYAITFFCIRQDKIPRIYHKSIGYPTQVDLDLSFPTGGYS